MFHSSRELRPASCQLPVSWYFDPEIFEHEKKLLFQAGPNYVGHELMVPKVGDYHTLAWMDHAKVLVRNASGVELLSQRLPPPPVDHAGGPRQRPEHRLPAAPLDLRPERRAARRAAFRRDAVRQAALDAAHQLERPAVRRAARSRARISPHHHRAPTGTSPATCSTRCASTSTTCNWKTFVETYLEVYHVDPFHPGLGNFTDCDNFSVDYGDEYSVQIVAAKAGLAKPGTPVYRKWHEACLKQLDGREPKYGALWASYFPGLTFEWYPNVLVVSHLIPRSPTRTTNVVEFYYPEEIVLFEREFIEAQQAAYVETALEDYEICQRLDRGRRAL